MNAPDRFELFLLGDGEKKVTYEMETRVANCANFTFNKEDHTLGNLLQQRLYRMKPVVVFAGYKSPHPLEAKFILRVQTDGSITPKEAVVQCCQQLVKDLSKLSQRFTAEWELKKMADQRE